MQERGRPPRRSFDAVGDLARYSGLGMAWVLSILLLGWGGLKLDERFGTSPLLVLAGSLAGIGAGFATLWARTSAPSARRDGKEPGSGRKR